MAMSRPAADATVEHDLRQRLARLSLEQKARLFTGADFWSPHPEPEVGLGRLVVSDGLAGFAGVDAAPGTSTNVAIPPSGSRVPALGCRLVGLGGGAGTLPTGDRARRRPRCP